MSKRPKVPYAKGRKFCIFCGAPADSEEHLWPKWASPVLPHAPSYERFILTGRRSRGTLKRTQYVRQGSPQTFRIKRVCRTCNSGWMSQYEQRVRFGLERLIQGK